jgi:hypothetical protein
MLCWFTLHNKSAHALSVDSVKVASALTACSRWSGEVRMGLRDIASGLVPFPKVNGIIPSLV